MLERIYQKLLNTVTLKPTLSYVCQKKIQLGNICITTSVPPVYMYIQSFLLKNYGSNAVQSTGSAQVAARQLLAFPILAKERNMFLHC
jgi:hypothetical protein